MKNLILTAILSIGLWAQGAANCDPGVYLKGFGGVNFIGGSSMYPEVKTGYVVGGCVGYKFNSPVRLEAEISYRDNQVGKSSSEVNFGSETKYILPVEFGYINSWTGTGNFLWDIPLGKVTPFLGAGVGYQVAFSSLQFGPDANGRLYVSSVEGRTITPVCQAIGGINFQFFKKTDMRTDYRYVRGVVDSLGNHTLAFTLMQSF